MPSSLHSIRTKGIIGTVKRFFTMRKRYGFGDEKMKRNLRSYLSILEEYDGFLTMFIPSSVLKNHSKFIKNLKTESLEVGLHGHIHVDHRELTADELKEHIERAASIFKKAGLEMEGFRAPYLALDESSLDVLSGSISYDSSQSYDSEVLPAELCEKTKYKRIMNYYDPVKEPTLTEVQGITRMPVWLPDDEILVDRFGMDDELIGEYWVKMAKKADSKDSPLVIQLHPERIDHCQKALRRLCKFGISKEARFVKLSHLATDFEEGKRTDDGQLQIAITGDLDMISLADRKEMKREGKRMEGGA